MKPTKRREEREKNERKKQEWKESVVGPLRFERRTSRLSAVRSTRLSYGPRCKFFMNYQIWKAFFGKASQSDNTFNTQFTTYTFCLNTYVFWDPKIYLQEAEPSWRQFYIWYWVYEGVLTKHCLIRAGRSGEDRYLGMVEASGSIPDRSIFHKKVSESFLKSYFCAISQLLLFNRSVN